MLVFNLILHGVKCMIYQIMQKLYIRVCFYYFIFIIKIIIVIYFLIKLIFF
jgi:hypothetical protein